MVNSGRPKEQRKLGIANRPAVPHALRTGRWYDGLHGGGKVRRIRAGKRKGQWVPSALGTQNKENDRWLAKNWDNFALHAQYTQIVKPRPEKESDVISEGVKEP